MNSVSISTLSILSEFATLANSKATKDEIFTLHWLECRRGAVGGYALDLQRLINDGVNTLDAVDEFYNVGQQCELKISHMIADYQETLGKPFAHSTFANLGRMIYLAELILAESILAANPEKIKQEV